MNLKSNKTQNLLIIFLSISLIVVFSFKVIYTNASTNSLSELITQPPIVNSYSNDEKETKNNSSVNSKPVEIFPEASYIEDETESDNSSNINSPVIEYIDGI